MYILRKRAGIDAISIVYKKANVFQTSVPFPRWIYNTWRSSKCFLSLSKVVWVLIGVEEKSQVIRGAGNNSNSIKSRIGEHDLQRSNKRNKTSESEVINPERKCSLNDKKSRSYIREKSPDINLICSKKKFRFQAGHVWNY